VSAKVIYKSFLRPLLFSVDSEKIHDFFIQAAACAELAPLASLLAAIFGLEHEKLSLSVFGLKFKNPFGLAAGFDKNCRAADFFSALGFGHIELGTVTPLAQPGNPKPRIFRLVEDQALINRMGFPSEGVLELAKRIKRVRSRAAVAAVLGINIGKNKSTELERASEDYQSCFESLRLLGDYFAINVSSPNTPELRKLQEPERLTALFQAIQAKNTDQKPLLVKIAPDLGWPELDQILECCLSNKISGIIAANTTLSRSGLKTPIEEQGGLSGAPLIRRSTEVVRYIKQRVGNRLEIIGVGGVNSFDDACSLIQAGAKLVQIYTGLVYQGPAFVKKLKHDLLGFMQKNSLTSFEELLTKINK